MLPLRWQKLETENGTHASLITKVGLFSPRPHSARSKRSQWNSGYLHLPQTTNSAFQGKSESSKIIAVYFHRHFSFRSASFCPEDNIIVHNWNFEFKGPTTAPALKDHILDRRRLTFVWVSGDFEMQKVGPIEGDSAPDIAIFFPFPIELCNVKEKDGSGVRCKRH